MLSGSSSELSKGQGVTTKENILVVLVAKNIPFEVLYDQDRKSYSLVGTDFNNYPTYLTLSDGTNCRVIRVGRPLVRDVSIDEEAGESA